jgi:translocation and assembly module TamA
MRIVGILICVLNISGLFAQSFRLELLDAKTGKPLKLNYQKNSFSFDEQKKILNDAIMQYQQWGYLTVTADSTKKQGDSLKVFINPGQLFHWSQLRNINVDEAALSNSGFRERLFRNRPFSIRQTNKLLKKCLEFYENNGYPFAAIKLDSLTIKNEKIEAGLAAETGDLFKIDSVSFKGTARISNRFLFNYIGVKPGDLYNEEVIQKIGTRLKELPFLTEQKPYDVFLLQNVALIRLYLTERKASAFSGLIGFLPNNTNTGKLLLTGEANLKLKNSLGRGESIEADWRRLQAETQNLHVRLAYPFVFNTPFGLDGMFELYKRDSTFINVHGNIGVQYLMKGTDYLKVFAEFRSSNLLSTGNLQNLLVLPDYADVSSRLYGLEINKTRLDYRLNPRKGVRLTARLGTGTRNIRKNPSLNQELYTGLTLNSVQYSGNVDFDWYIPIFNRATINVGILGATMRGIDLFENELARIGGINSLRGFDDESIFASSFGILNLEYRYLFEENSFLFVFGNGAYYENKVTNRNISDLPYGLGAGISFQTKPGIFSISYALGSQFGNPLEFKTAKIHFGITSLF